MRTGTLLSCAVYKVTKRPLLVTQPHPFEHEQSKNVNYI